MNLHNTLKKKQLVHGCMYKYPGTLKQHVHDKTVTLSITVLENIHHNSQSNTILCLSIIFD